MNTKKKKSLCPILGIPKPRRYAMSSAAWATLSEGAREKAKGEMRNPRKGTLRRMVLS